MKMYYGENDKSRLYNPDDASKVFSWLLSSVVDKFGNQITYEYEETIEYGKRVNLYPVRILYGYNNVYSVNFNWEDREDVRSSLRSGFLTISNRRLSHIEIQYQYQILRRYDLSYEMGAFRKSILSRITEKGQHDVVINESEFVYDTDITDAFSSETTVMETDTWNIRGDEDIRYTYTESYDDGHRSRSHTEVNFMDINGDGLPDWIAKNRNDRNFYIQINTGTRFKYITPWYTPEWFYHHGYADITYIYTSAFERIRKHTEIDFADINGDGLPDRIAKHRDYENFYVQLNTGHGFINVDPWYTPDYWDIYHGYRDIRYTCSIEDDDTMRNHTELDFMDINGDGLPDRIAKHRDDDRFRIQLNTGKDFKNSGPLYTPYWYYHGGYGDIRYSRTRTYEERTRDHTEIDFVDINGDGLPDRIAKHKDY
jgi:hypothetical protein